MSRASSPRVLQVTSPRIRHLSSPRGVLAEAAVVSPRQRLAETRLNRLLPRPVDGAAGGAGSPPAARLAAVGHRLDDAGRASPAGRRAAAASRALEIAMAGGNAHNLGSPRQLQKRRQPVHVRAPPPNLAATCSVTGDHASFS